MSKRSTNGGPINGLKAGDFYKSKYTNAASVGKKVISAKITGVGTEIVGESKEEKPAIYFEDLSPLIMNKANWETLREEFGDDCNSWANKRIELFTVDTGFEGKKGLRIRVPDFDDDIPESVRG